jgi:hypothetical protein
MAFVGGGIMIVDEAYCGCVPKPGFAVSRTVRAHLAQVSPHAKTLGWVGVFLVLLALVLVSLSFA